MIEQKGTSSSRKTTNCTECSRLFWYIDPRPGGRPRQKCGICSSRPPRYPWGFLDGTPNEFGVTNDPAYATEGRPKHPSTNSLPHKRTRGGTNHETDNRRMMTDDAADNPYPLPSPYPSPLPLSGAYLPESHADTVDNAMLTRIEQKLDRLESRLVALETQFSQNHNTTVHRSDWVDLCARLDIVEQLTTETLGQVRSKLETFSKDIKHIAVIPERELNEMFDMVRHIRLQLMPDHSGNR